MTASNGAIVQELFQEINNHDLATIMDLCSECVYHLPLVGELRGEALRQFFASVLKAFPTSNERLTTNSLTIFT